MARGLRPRDAKDRPTGPAHVATRMAHSPPRGAAAQAKNRATMGQPIALRADQMAERLAGRVAVPMACREAACAAWGRRGREWVRLEWAGRA
jgi:hypothetical protein